MQNIFNWNLSVGVAMYPVDGRTAQNLIEAADRQLYERKRKVHSRKLMNG
jgi:GGDEF domain-containing protein